MRKDIFFDLRLELERLGLSLLSAAHQKDKKRGQLLIEVSFEAKDYKLEMVLFGEKDWRLTTYKEI